MAFTYRTVALIHTRTTFLCFTVELFTLSKEKSPESSGDCYGSYLSWL